MKDILRRGANRLAMPFGLTVAARPAGTGITAERLALHLRSEYPDEPGYREFLAWCVARAPQSSSQFFQDLFVAFALGPAPGMFCEFGAADGTTFSNSLYLERELGWRGILAEPARAFHAALRRNRPDATIDTRCVFDSSGEEVEFVEAAHGPHSGLAATLPHDMHALSRRRSVRYTVATVSLNDLLHGHGVATLDYLSVDVEGAEQKVLAAFDVSRWRPAVLTVELQTPEAERAVDALLAGHGFARVLRRISDVDGWYVDRDRVTRPLPE